MQARAALASAVLFLLVDGGSCAMYRVGDLVYKKGIDTLKNKFLCEKKVRFTSSY
jgi:hypothetical protein